MFKNTLFILCLKDFIEQCLCCKHWSTIYIHGIMPDVSASFDGATVLPIIARVPGIKYPMFPKLYDLPGFGSFLYGHRYVDNSRDGEFILLCAAGALKCQSESSRLLMFNNKHIVCFVDIENNFVFIDTDGALIEAIYIVSEAASNNCFDIGNSRLKYEVLPSKELSWTYTRGAVLKTKPAASLDE